MKEKYQISFPLSVEKVNEKFLTTGIELKIKFMFQCYSYIPQVRSYITS